MSDSHFKSAPDLQQEFQGVDARNASQFTHAVDAERWEPTEEPDLPEIAQQHLTLDFTPGGHLEQEVHTQLDDRARAALRAATQQRCDPREDMQSLGDQWNHVSRSMNDRWNGQNRSELRTEQSWEDCLNTQQADRSRRQEREHDQWGDADR